MVTINTTTPTHLLARIKKGIDDGSIKTWAYDSEGDLTHIANQWNQKGWLRPQVTLTSLQLKFVAPASGASREVFAVYQGRFQEMMMAHFWKSYTVSSCTPEPTSADSGVTG
jgi:hypothetical protein